MNSKLVKSNKWCAVLGAFLLLAFIPRDAFAQFNLTYNLDVVSNANWTEMDYLTEQARIQSALPSGAKWGLPFYGSGLITNNHGYTELAVPSGWAFIAFKTMTNYYFPVLTGVYNIVGGTVVLTNRYIPYSNTLSVVVTGITGGASARWWITTPSELTNSSAYKPVYTNSQYGLYPIPTGNYTIVFSNVPGYVEPATITTNITLGLNPTVTGTYTVAALTSSVLKVRFQPVGVQSTAQWWVDNIDFPAPGGPFGHNDSTNLAVSNDYQVSYSTMRGYKYPTNTDFLNFYGDVIYTNTYIPYSNSLAVSVVGIRTISNVIWDLAGYPLEFVNSSNYGAFFTNVFNGIGLITTTTVAAIPTGTYTVSFRTLPGYTLTSANPQATNIVDASPAISCITGTYSRQYGTLQINVLPAACSNATWTIITRPDDYTNLVTGTGTYTIASVPVGSYTVSFNDFPPYVNPANDSGAVSEGITTTLSGTYTISGYNLIMNIGPPYESQASLPGIGAGYVIVRTALETNIQTASSATYTVPSGTAVSLTAYPTNPGGTSIDSFVYKWYWDSDATPANTELYVTNITFTMSGTRYYYLLFSKEMYYYDNVGDIDQDGLPDRWEIDQFGDALSGGPAEVTTTPYGRTDNTDDDFIPSSSTNPPTLATLNTNLWGYTGIGANAGYPLTRIGLLSLGTAYYQAGSLGYAKGVKFNNYLECRGIDTYYRTNTPAGFTYASPLGDDPMTDPLDNDTDNDDMWDGWEYYFWYWRSASSFAAGVSNSANLSWVRISPCDDREVVQTGPDWDTDGDETLSTGNDLYEFRNGTDPTHADTDGDGMDDTWEIEKITPSAVSNALDYVNWSANPDGDYYATVTNVLVLTNGMVGTAFASNTVCYSTNSGGMATNPSGAWVNIYTNTGSNVFDLYQDTILKATVALTNRQFGAVYTNMVYYGTNAGLGAFQQGYPVWVDMNGNGIFNTNIDIAIVNLFIKHEAVYLMAPAIPDPGVCSFDPRTAWTNAFPDDFAVINEAPNTQPYNNYQEYLGGDYIGRISWDAGGRVTVLNDIELALNRNSYTLPNNQDTDADQIPDGWELYVGLNPNSSADATADPDVDALNNFSEWANSTHALGSCAADWPHKTWPTDPGVITAPPPNDPHPRDTDWDGLVDGYGTLIYTGGSSSPTTNNGEYACRSNPTDADTDRQGSVFAEGLPDGWEVYAGTDPLVRDQNLDSDYDGLLNWQEYWTGTVPEWMDCDPAWGMKFIARRYMDWNPPWIAAPIDDRYTTFGSALEVDTRWFMPPDFLTCPSFLYANGAITNVDNLRTNFPAANSLGFGYYHTTLAGNNNQLRADPDNAGALSAAATDSDGDGMDDFWEVYHCLNPCRGYRDLVYGSWNMQLYGPNLIVGSDDADPTQPGYQVGTQGAPFANVMALVNYYRILRAQATDGAKAARVIALVGPHNFGLVGMDPDNDGLVNFDEYTYYRQSHLHTSPSPLWRTDPYASGVYSFVARNYTRDNTRQANGWNTSGFSLFAGIIYSFSRGSIPFRWAAMTEGFDTDNDLINDYDEVTGYRDGTNTVAGTDPLNDESPLHNRVVWLDGTNSWLRSYAWSPYGDFSKFSVEAWVRPSRLSSAADQVVVEKTSRYTMQLPDSTFASSALANFQLGISANGVPYVLFHNVSGFTTNRALASSIGGQLQVGTWAHLAGVFDGAKLTVYVNGEASATHHTTDVPARGLEGDYSTWHPNCNLSIGARELSPGWMFPVAGEKFFAGCIDEVRVWDRVLSVGDIIARKNRRLTSAEIGTVFGGNEPYMEGTNNLFAYYRFTDLPDPTQTEAGDGIRPSGFPTNRPALSHNYSLVYTNYLVIASDRVKKIPRMVPLDTRVIDGVPVSTNGTLDAYGITTTNYLGIILPADFRNSANPYNFTHGIYNIDMGRGMWLCGWAQGLKTNTWLGTLDPDNPDSTDTDGDGLPDWWEQLYGLDIYDATGENGAWGDPDSDGLDNIAEYRALTNPRNSDTHNTGVSDYDYHSARYTRTLGEIYMDGDGMPNVWETQNGLDPQKYDAHLDLDGDGWSNYAEYQAGTDPNNKYDYPLPLVSGMANYYGSRTGMLRFYAYEINTMDGEPQITKIGTDSLVAEVVGQANGTFIFTGRLPIAPIDVTTVVRISAPLPTNNVFVTFTFTGPEAYTYSGVGVDYAANLSYVNGRFTLRWASAEVPALGADVSVEYSYVNRNAAAFSLAGFKEGDFYVLSLLDDSGNGEYDSGEPIGIMEDQPVYLSYSSISGIRVLLTDTHPGFGRFAWTAAATVTNAYPVVINKISENGAPIILSRAMTYPRNYFHEWDFQLQGIEGLMAGTYQWWMGPENGTFPINWPAAANLATPTLVYPRGDMLYYARNQFAWTMDLNCPMAHMQIVRDADGVVVVDKNVRSPWMDEQGIFRGWMADYASDWGNGVFYWRLAGWTPQGESAWSEWQTFDVNLSAANSRSISGDIYYFGKAPTTKIIVEAYKNRGFGGPPAARTTVVMPAGAGQCSYILRGLEQDAYYVRAFLDITPAAGGTGATNKLDAWESVGFYRDPNNSYQAGLVNLVDAQFMNGAKIIIRDKDTDNDELPDAWEMYFFGNLDQTGDMDYDGDGETNLQEYIKDGVNQNPASWDTDGDGLSDGFEPHYTGAAFGFGRSRNQVAATLNPNVWDTDGDGYSDGAELWRYRTDPLDPTSYPRYQPFCTDAWASPGDYDGDGRSDFGVYDFNAGVWSFITMAGQFYELPFGIKGAQPMVGDYTGDNCSEFTFYDKGLWSIYMQSGDAGSGMFGDASMLPASADYTGDGRTDLAVFDTDNGMWYIYDLYSGAMIAGKFGASGMIPVPGDYNGDGGADLVLYEPVKGNWLLGLLHRYYQTFTVFGGQLGGPTWTPVPGDYDGDGCNDLCLFEGATGRWALFTMSGQYAEGTFGWKGCVPVPGDYDGDGTTDFAIYDTNTGMWYIVCGSGAYYEGGLGGPGALPILKGR